MSGTPTQVEGLSPEGVVDPEAGLPGKSMVIRAGEFPWWLVGLIAIIAYLGYLTFFSPTYEGAKEAVLRGIPITIRATLIAFGVALVLGLIAGLGRISRNLVIRNLATLYVEFIRGVPMLVLIFTVALVLIPPISDALGIENRLSNEWRAIIALALIYGGYIAEVFRAGIESVGVGQTEAGRSLGMTRGQTMRTIVLPQAVRNILPALGNDFIAMFKDSSLLSVLSVFEITYLARRHANNAFEFREAFLVTTFLYLTGTLLLSLSVNWYARRLQRQ
ncbi:MAG TPA: amino acid ABC transporter permease [Acidimicrobiia bacterium]|jgi:polar amino acid transport system permease protein|nr:amino acid ABC transporter permease [Acidimicrobiia bacterium]